MDNEFDDLCYMNHSNASSSVQVRVLRRMSFDHGPSRVLALLNIEWYLITSFLEKWILTLALTL